MLYVDRKIAQAAANATTQTFWEDVYELMESDGISEGVAPQKLDRTGGKRKRCPKPDHFPDCFAANAQTQPTMIPDGGADPQGAGALAQDP